MLEVLINPCAGGQVRRAKEAVERLCKKRGIPMPYGRRQILGRSPGGAMSWPRPAPSGWWSWAGTEPFGTPHRGFGAPALYWASCPAALETI